MPTTTINVDEVLLGPGLLYAAPIDTPDISDTATPLSSAWREVGYTDEGSTIDIAYDNQPVPVAEEFYPVKYVTVGVEMSVGFAMKQLSRRNLALATNSGADAANDGTSFEPPDPGNEVRVKLVLETEEGARWLFRQCFQGGTLSISRNKAPNVALLPVQFRLEKPSSNAPFEVFPTADGQI